MLFKLYEKNANNCMSDVTQRPKPNSALCQVVNYDDSVADEWSDKNDIKQ